MAVRGHYHSPQHFPFAYKHKESRFVLVTCSRLFLSSRVGGSWSSRNNKTCANDSERQPITLYIIYIQFGLFVHVSLYPPNQFSRLLIGGYTCFFPVFYSGEPLGCSLCGPLQRVGRSWGDVWWRSLIELLFNFIQVRISGLRSLDKWSSHVWRTESENMRAVNVYIGETVRNISKLRFFP